MYLDTIRLGIVIFLGFAGSGKTERAVLTALLFILNNDIGKIYGSAPTNVSTSNFAERLYVVGSARGKEPGEGLEALFLGNSRTERQSFGEESQVLLEQNPRVELGCARWLGSRRRRRGSALTFPQFTSRISPTTVYIDMHGPSSS